MTDDLATDTWMVIRDHPDTAASSPAHVMENLAAFRADPCASTWYGFIVRLGLLVKVWEVHAILGDLDPFPQVTTQALVDVKLARGATAEAADD